MRRIRPAKATPGEHAFIRDMKRRSVIELVESGEAEILPSSDYPEPIKRFLRRERTMVHLRLSLAAKRRLQAASRRRGMSAEELARLWVEQGLEREAG